MCQNGLHIYEYLYLCNINDQFFECRSMKVNGKNYTKTLNDDEIVQYIQCADRMYL